MLATAGTVANAQPAGLALTREIRIDGVAENLVTPRWILVGRDGRIAIDQQADRSVRFFDASGRPIGRFGRRGEGPGEFQFMTGAGWVGDSLWLHDGLSQRTTLVTPGLEFARVIPDLALKPAPGQETRFAATTTSDRKAMYADGNSLVLVSRFSGAIPAGFDTIGFRIFRAAGDGVIRNQVVHLNQPGGRVRVLAGSRYIQAGTPFYARPLFRISERGNRMALLTCVYDGPQGGTMRVVMFGTSGDTVYARNYPFTPQAIPRAVADSGLAAAIETARNAARFIGAEEAATLTRAVRERMRIPPYFPPFTGMAVGDDGAAWIELRSPAGGATSFMVLDPRGSVSGTVAVPARTKALNVSATHMWGIELDQDDVPSVVRYRVVGR
jgi:hypothetical protein